MIIYRVEGPDGTGPYYFRNNPVLEAMAAEHNGTHHDWPGMWADVTDRNEAHISEYWDGERGRHDWRCGFESMDELRHWFRGWMDKLAHLGYMPKAYAVDEEHVEWGWKQVIFISSEAKLLASLDYDSEDL